jgi:hypothetical protein
MFVNIKVVIEMEFWALVANVECLEFHRCHDGYRQVIVAEFCIFRHVRKIAKKDH